MGWTSTQWSCGHEGSMQLYGKLTARYARVAHEAGRKCMICWLLDQWETDNDPRSKRDDKVKLASDIARGRGIAISTS